MSDEALILIRLKYGPPTASIKYLTSIPDEVIKETITVTYWLLHHPVPPFMSIDGHRSFLLFLLSDQGQTLPQLRIQELIEEKLVQYHYGNEDHV